MENSSKIILGMLAAAAAGVAIGMLVAPEKGSDLRQKIGDKASDLASKVGDLVSYGKEKWNDVTGSVTDQVDGLVNDTKRRGEFAKESLA
jgi:gas vesicle protein